MYKIAFIILAFVIGGCSSLSDEKTQFQNPVFEPTMADPSVIETDDGMFYVYGTEDHFDNEIGQPIVPVAKSKDLINWEYVGSALEEKPAWKQEGYVWAPDVVFHQEQYYMYYSISTWGDPNPGIGLAISDNPEGPFEDQGSLIISDEIGVANSIDPMFFKDDNGQNYLFWGSFHGIYGVELSEDGKEIISDKFQIAGTAFEASYIIKRDESYYYFGSLGSCCEGLFSEYRLAVGKADSIEGPYYDKEGNSLMDSHGTLVMEGHELSGEEGEVFVGPGHNAIITDAEGTDWLVYHAIDKSKPYLPLGATRRPLMIDPIVWEDGWPTLKDKAPNFEDQPAPIIE